MRLAIVAGAIVLAGCTPSAEMRASEQAEAARDLADAIQGRVADKPEDCIPIQGVNGPQIIDRETLVYRDGRRVYVNKLAGECPSLSQDDTLIVELHNSQICRNDLFRVLDTGTGIPSAYCRFGKFTPYTKP